MQIADLYLVGAESVKYALANVIRRCLIRCMVYRGDVRGRTCLCVCLKVYFSFLSLSFVRDAFSLELDLERNNKEGFAKRMNQLIGIYKYM